MQIFHLLHLIGMALLLGGLVCSLIIVQSRMDKIVTISISYKMLHMVYTLGLTLLIVTGIVQSQMYHWLHFKGAGYMHAKIMLVIITLLFIFLDIKTQKKILKTVPRNGQLDRLVKKRQIFAFLSICCTLVIIYLIAIKPF